MIEKYEFKIEEIHGNESDFCVYDRNGIKCCRYDTLYDESGSEYIFDGIVYVRAHGFFQRFFLIEKAGYKAALSLRVSNVFTMLTQSMLNLNEYINGIHTRDLEKV